MKRKHALRIGTILCILVFLLIPLMSSPVAASFIEPLGGVWTVNSPAGPNAGGNVGAPANISDNSPFNAKFSVEYIYKDNNTGGSGSNHWTEIIVYYKPPNTGWQGPVLCSQTPIFISAGGGTRTGTYTTPWIPAMGSSYGGWGTIFELNVVVHCHDIASNYTYSWSSDLITFDIIP